MIVGNNEETLEACLQSITGHVDEIIIVDTGSRDRTIEIAKKYTDKVFNFVWINDFAAARNFSLLKASGDLILWMDSDDILPKESVIAIEAIRHANDPQAAYCFNINNVDMAPPANKWRNKYPQIRIFPKFYPKSFNKRILFQNEGVSGLHESVEKACIDADLEVRGLDFEIEHQGYKDRGVLDRKILRNLRLANFAEFKKATGREPKGYYEFRMDEHFCLYYEGRTLIYGSVFNFATQYEQLQYIGDDKPFQGIEKELNQEEILTRIIDGAEAAIEKFDSVKSLQAEIDRMENAYKNKTQEVASV
jgi:glycosyltransferase involved in cell wall biosynthesis